ncbi:MULTISPECIES: DUF4350 domain-containing protein [unclassified Carboxylicivirga]|uniref:DUF4350 domain-containing protein n=1 Tax=Carboxylicivirga TaxID=1628153 RepID=UPI003D3258F0
MKGPSYNKILLSATLFVVGLMVLMMAAAPQPIDWSLSFSKQDTKPFGSKLLYRLLPELFNSSPITTSHSALASFFSAETPTATNIIIINNEFAPDADDIIQINELLKQQNHLFMAASSIGDSLRQQLGIEYEQRHGITLMGDSVSFNLANRKLKTHLGYWYNKGISNNYFTRYDSTRTTVLGFNNSGKTNFIKIQQGGGQVYLNLNPQAFTNFNLVQGDNYEYAFKCLSYLPNQSTVWDEHYKYKYGAGAPASEGQGSLLGFILARTPLRLAWYLLLIGIFIFLLFQSARRQRAIPAIKIPVNSTVNFIETIGRLYFSRKNHLDIARKRFSYLLAYVRNRYYLNTTAINDEFYQQLADKSSVSVRTIKQLFELGLNLDQLQRISEEDLEQFNRRIEYFYDHCQ